MESYVLNRYTNRPIKASSARRYVLQGIYKYVANTNNKEIEKIGKAIEKPIKKKEEVFALLQVLTLLEMDKEFAKNPALSDVVNVIFNEAAIIWSRATDNVDIDSPISKIVFQIVLKLENNLRNEERKKAKGLNIIYNFAKRLICKNVKCPTTRAEKTRYENAFICEEIKRLLSNYRSVQMYTRKKHQIHHRDVIFLHTLSRTFKHICHYLKHIPKDIRDAADKLEKDMKTQVNFERNISEDEIDEIFKYFRVNVAKSCK